MFNLKLISKEGIARAIEKVERYRLLNEPEEAESICRDILNVDPENQQAIAMLILSLSDQFVRGVTPKECLENLPKLKDDYTRAYYEGIIHERQAKANFDRGNPGSHHDAFEYMEDAMEAYETAMKIKPQNNDEAILRWNACVRTIERHHLMPRERENREPHLE